MFSSVYRVYVKGVQSRNTARPPGFAPGGLAVFQLSPSQANKSAAGRNLGSSADDVEGEVVVTVIVGVGVELTGEEAEKARNILYNLLCPMNTSSTVHTHEHHVESEISDAERIKPIVYRIKIKEKSGRFEKR